MTSARQQLMEHARPLTTGKDILFAGMMSLVLHALAILLTISALNLHSAPEKMEKSPGLNVSFVNLSSHPASQVQQSEFRGKRPEPAASEKEKSTSSKSKIQEKQTNAHFSHDTEDIKEKTVNKDSMVIVPAGSDPQADRSEIALYTSPAAAATGTASGTDAKSQGSGAISSGSTGQKGDKPGELSGTLPSAVSRYKQTPPPIYPHAARQKGYEGLVLISVEILENGATGQLLVKKSSGYAVLDQAALSAVKKWKFIPAVKNNVRVRTWGDVPIRFVLQDAR